MIILDLQSEQFPQYKRLKSYFGQPFIWCMLHNFGGTLGMFGSSEIINEVFTPLFILRLSSFCKFFLNLNFLNFKKFFFIFLNYDID